MSRPVDSQPSSFPYWVALCSLGLVLWLFFSNTVPALHEREELQKLEHELRDLKTRFDAAITAARLGRGPTAESDLQSLFVAIDQRGYTPAELAAAFPAPAPGSLPGQGEKER